MKTASMRPWRWSRGSHAPSAGAVLPRTRARRSRAAVPGARAADALLARRWRRSRRRCRGMNARVRATSWLGGERVRATVNMLVERDGHLRFEAEVSLQGTVATLATDGTTFALLRRAQERVLARARLPGQRRLADPASRWRPPTSPPCCSATRARPTPIDPATAPVGWDAAPRRRRAGGARPRRAARCSSCFAATARRATLVAVDASGPDGAPLWRTAYEDFETRRRRARARHDPLRRGERQLRRRRRDQVQGPRAQRGAARRARSRWRRRRARRSSTSAAAPRRTSMRGDRWSLSAAARLRRRAARGRRCGGSRTRACDTRSVRRSQASDARGVLRRRGASCVPAGRNCAAGRCATALRLRRRTPQAPPHPRGIAAVFVRPGSAAGQRLHAPTPAPIAIRAGRRRWTRARSPTSAS